MAGMEVEFTGKAAEALYSTADQLGLNVCDALRQGIAVYKYLHDAEEAGASIRIQNPADGTARTLDLGNNTFELWETELRDIQ